MIATNTTREVSATSGILGKRRAKPTPPRPGKSLYFLVRSHAPVWRVFRTSIVQGEGVILITGEPGVGKSHFLNRLKDVLPDNRDMVQIPDPTLSSEEFLHCLMDAVKHGGAGKKGLPQVDVTRKQLLDALEERAVTGRRLLVAIDQAHMLTDENAALLSLLVPFSAKDIKPVQLLLVGRPELWGCLESEPFKDIRKEIIGSGEITPLTRSEVLDFIHFFIRKSIGRHIRVSWFAWVDIFSISQGNPFRIEQILVRTLALIKMRPRWIITRSLVYAAQQKEQDMPVARSYFGQKVAIFAAVVLLVVVGLYSWPFGSSAELPSEEKRAQTFTRIDLPSTAPVVKESKPEVIDESPFIDTTSVPARAVILPPQDTPKKIILKAKSERVILKAKSERIIFKAKSEVFVAPPKREVSARVAPLQGKPKRIIWNPKTRGRTPIYPAPVPLSRPMAVSRAVVKKKLVERVVYSAPGVEPRKRGSFVSLKNFKPLQVSQSMPDTAPLQVGSREDRALGKVVAEVHQQDSIDSMSGVDSSPLPLTTEDTLKSAGKIFVVQIGSFLNRDNAERLMLDLSSDGLEPYVHLFKQGAKSWYSVRMNYRNQNSAERMANEISKSKSMPARVIELFYE